MLLFFLAPAGLLLTRPFGGTTEGVLIRTQAHSTANPLTPAGPEPLPLAEARGLFFWFLVGRGCFELDIKRRDDHIHLNSEAGPSGMNTFGGEETETLHSVSL